MREIEDKQLEKIEGGISTWGVVGICAAAVFIIGVIDGIVRPLKCN